MLYPLKRVTWGPANNYANSAVTQQTLSDVVYDIETKDPDLKGKAEEACCK